jgi:hypothetical protein
MRELADLDPRVRYVSFSRNFWPRSRHRPPAWITRWAVPLCSSTPTFRIRPSSFPPWWSAGVAGADVVYAQRRVRAGRERLQARHKLALLPRHRSVSATCESRTTSAISGSCRHAWSKPSGDLKRTRASCEAWFRGSAFKQEAVQYDRDARHAGETKYQIRQMLHLAAEAIAAFSLKPLKLTLYLGLAAIPHLRRPHADDHRAEALHHAPRRGPVTAASAMPQGLRAAHVLHLLPWRGSARHARASSPTTLATSFAWSNAAHSTWSPNPAASTAYLVAGPPGRREAVMVEPKVAIATTRDDARN